MMETFADILPIIIDVLGIVLLVVLIIIGIRVIKLLNVVDGIVKDVDYKVKSLNNVFYIIDKTTDALANVSDKIIDFVNNLIIKIFKKKYNNKKEEEEYE